MPTIERIVALESVDESGNPTIDLPITSVECIEDFPSAMPANGGNAATVGGHTVLSDVPANAKFTDTNTTYSAATQSANGLMSAADKKKLDGIAAGANVNTITGVKGNAENTYRTGNVNITPDNIGAAAASHTHAASAITGLPTSLPANGGNAATVGGHTVLSDVPANAKFTDTNTTYGNASATTAGLVSTGAQTFAGDKTFNGQILPAGASAAGTPQARKLASGTAAATTTNCPSGAWYGRHS